MCFLLIALHCSTENADIALRISDAYFVIKSLRRLAAELLQNLYINLGSNSAWLT